MVTDGTRFGYTAAQWDALVDTGREFLETLARRQAGCSYTEFCDEVNRHTGLTLQPHDHALPHVLGQIGSATWDDRGVVVTAIVHYKYGGFEAGPGFFSLCQELELLPKRTPSEDERLVFHAAHVTKVYEAYRPAGRPRQ
jgi:hypothetical protein